MPIYNICVVAYNSETGAGDGSAVPMKCKNREDAAAIAYTVAANFRNAGFNMIFTSAEEISMAYLKGIMKPSAPDMIVADPLDKNAPSGTFEQWRDKKGI